MMRAAVRPMRAQGRGRMVVIVGQLGRQPHPRMLPSATANAALLAAIKGLADEVAGDGVVVNAVNPGPSRTERWNRLMTTLASDTGRPVAQTEEDFTADIPMRRFGEPDEIARHVCFLASDAAGYMTGTSITADGGWIKLPA
jgi:3-oxoacyl-[acyl-carrier protein] reductase